MLWSSMAKRSMRLSKSDIVASVFGAAVLAALSCLIYIDLTRGRWDASGEPIGMIANLTNTAERKFSSQVVWYNIGKGSELYNFDTVRTGDRAEAVIRLMNGSEITLSENSMVMLSISKTESEIKFLDGAIQTNVAQGGGKSGSVRITSGESSVSLSDGAVSVIQEQGNRMQVTVNRGSATLTDGDTKKVVSENQSVIAGDGGIRLYDLSIKLIAPENNNLIQATGEKTNTTFTWVAPGRGYTSYLEVSANPLVADPFIKKRTLGNVITTPLPEGTYYWKVSAVHEATKKIETSEIRKLTIARATPILLIMPAERSVIKYHGKKPLVTFLWSNIEDIPQYRLIVARNADLSTPVIDTQVAMNRIAVDTLGEGAYYWRVIPITNQNQTNAAIASAVAIFTISKTNRIEPPEPLYPPDKKTFHPLAVSQRGIPFSWKKEEGLSRTELRIAIDRSFQNTIFTTSTTDSFYRYIGSLNEGTYYWRLVSAAGDVTDSVPSRTFEFRIAREGTISLIAPHDRSVFIMRGSKEKIAIPFSWSRSEFEGEYQVQISPTPDFSSIVTQLKVSEPSASIGDLGEGRYFWRVRQIERNGNEIIASPHQSFEILTSLDAPLLVTPAPGKVIDMRNQDSIDFIWKPVAGAERFRISLFHKKDGIMRAVYAAELQNTRLRFSDLPKLDEGLFVWTVQAIDIDQTVGRIRRTSDEARSAFTISLGEKPKSIKIESPKILYIE